MKYAFSNEQMRRADAAAIAAGTPASELMERAGKRAESKRATSTLR